MKREYTRPTVEKLAFNYRNQVVAASGVAALNEETASNPYNIPDDIWNIVKDLGLDKLADFLNRYFG